MTNGDQTIPGGQPPATGAQEPPDTPGPEESPPTGIRKWWWVIALAVVALAVIIGLLIWASGDEGEELAMVTVPDVVGMTQEEAEAALTDVGLAVGDVAEEQNADAEPGSVLAQDPEAATEVEEGSTVDLVIAIEEVVEMVVVPDVVGMTVGEAKNTLQGVGLVVGEVAEEEDTDATPGDVLSQDPAAGTEVEPGGSVNLVVAVGPTASVVPNVVGMTEPDAVAAIEAAGFVARVYIMNSEDVPKGVTIEQQPAAGEELEAGGTVGIAVSAGPTPPPESGTVVVPDVSGQPADQAAAALEAAGLVPQIFDVYSDSVPEGNVVTQFPTAGTEVLKGSAVAVVASKGTAPDPGPGTVEAPNVVGMTVADAEAAITAAGLDVIPLVIPYDQADVGTVFFQLPPAGSVMQVGSYMVVIVAGEPVAGMPPMVAPYMMQ